MARRPSARTSWRYVTGDAQQHVVFRGPLGELPALGELAGLERFEDRLGNVLVEVHAGNRDGAGADGRGAGADVKRATRSTLRMPPLPRCRLPLWLS